MSSNQSDLTAFDGETPDNACVRYEICSNVVPEGGQMCADYLDELRARDREERQCLSLDVISPLEQRPHRHRISPPSGSAGRPK